ncbi:MAG TPA: hypothetical protein PKD99_12445 [Sphingopyxis sp.]|nr:hypothetical protein [Sphingopyxis sp.]HMP45908.1 hypothetical protein [Sphingopyxis sp.]
MGAPVLHKRMHPKVGAEPTAAERRHHDRVRAFGCLVSGRPATIHHVTGYADKIGRFSRSHRLVVPLAPEYHQHDHGRLSVEKLSHRGFFQEWGIDLYAEARRLEAESVAMGVLPHV